MGRSTLTAIIWLFLASSVFSDEPDKSLHEKCLYPSVMISMQGGSGSGVIVRSEKSGLLYRNIVISAAHIFDSDHDEFFVKIAKWKNWSDLEELKEYAGKIYVVDKKLDLSVIAFETPYELPCVDFGFDEELFIGSEIMRIGCGLGDPMRVDFGKLTSTNGAIVPDVRSLRTNIFTVPGDSGGGVFHKNKLIGLMQAIRNTQHGICYNISFVVPVGHIKTWSARLNNSIDFTFDKTKSLPVLVYKYKELEDASFSGPHAKQKIWRNP